MIGQTPPSPETVEATVPLPGPAPQPVTKPEPVLGHAVEIGGREGPEPTRYGDWEKNGRCIDF
ncbi:MAG: DUF1674 domain-containing protein [Lysobacteraceae bacterium]|nr:MAG: DUF1674 domain-containing protein [Xanthomonadaceae bacterium]